VCGLQGRSEGTTARASWTLVGTHIDRTSTSRLTIDIGQGLKMRTSQIAFSDRNASRREVKVVGRWIKEAERLRVGYDHVSWTRYAIVRRRQRIGVLTVCCRVEVLP
jgi:hypothetical protein